MFLRLKILITISLVQRLKIDRTFYHDLLCTTVSVFAIHLLVYTCIHEFKGPIQPNEVFLYTKQTIPYLFALN